MSTRMVVLAVFAWFCATLQFAAATPSQVHLSYTGSDEGEMMVSYVTMKDTVDSVAKVRPYQSQEQWTEFSGNSVKFVDGGSKRSVRFVHRVVMSGLQAAAAYEYMVGDEKDGWSTVYKFNAMRSMENKTKDARPWRFICLADMGLDNDRTLENITNLVQTSADAQAPYDAILHAGDLAYDFHEKQGTVGDEFMAAIEPVASTVPYMTCPGNHESRYNFSHYRNRFSMPNYESTENLWYSFNVGPVHFVSYSTESYFDYQKGKALNDTLQRQYEWLQQDLEAANSARSTQPWIIVQGHRPLYCTNWYNATVGCGPEQEQSRHGSYRPGAGNNFAVEPLFYKYGVDLWIGGHVHDYTRYWPVYNLEVKNGTTDPSNPYHNPRATTYMTIGAAGNHEMHFYNGCIHDGACVYPSESPYAGGPSPFAACTAGTAPNCPDFNFGEMTVYNETHLHWVQHSSVQRKTIDEMWLIQEHHGSFEGRKLSAGNAT
eukprot:g8656.t1